MKGKICLLRDICNSIGRFETLFLNEHSITLNEGMVLCSLKEGSRSSGEIAKEINLACSNTSKLIRTIEEKGLIERGVGVEDRRQMYFSLSESGKSKLKEIEGSKLEFEEPLKSLL
ncbi:MAG: winged helix DNA-binding protein [Bacteroidales bacterium]